MIGLRGESMNPMTFGNMIHPSIQELDSRVISSKFAPTHDIGTCNFWSFKVKDLQNRLQGLSQKCQPHGVALAIGENYRL